MHTTVSGNTEPAMKLTSPSIRSTFDDVVIDMVTSLYKKLNPDKSNVTILFLTNTLPLAKNDVICVQGIALLVVP